jgi:hypothetical protein
MFALGSVCLLWCGQGRCGSPDGQAQQLRGYKLFMQVYLYIPERGIFEAVPGMPYHLPKQICEAQDALQQIDRAGTRASRTTPAASGQNAAAACWLSLLHSLLKSTEQLVYAYMGLLCFRSTSRMLPKSGLLKAQLCLSTVQAYIGCVPDHIQAATTAVVTIRTDRLYFLCMAWLACTSSLFSTPDLQGCLAVQEAIGRTSMQLSGRGGQTCCACTAQQNAWCRAARAMP